MIYFFFLYMARDTFFILEMTTMPGFLFTLYWSAVFVFISLSLPKIFGMIFYSLVGFMHIFMSITHIVCLKATDKFFSFSLLTMKSEGKGYIKDAILSVNTGLWLYVMLVVAFFVLGIYFLARREIKRIKGICVPIGIFLMIPLHFLVVTDLGKNDKSWDADWRLPRGIYESYIDKDKAFLVSGITEYTIKDLYLYCTKTGKKISDKDKAFLDGIFSEERWHVPNGYTGLYKGKNLILIQFEGLDNWLLDDEHTPYINKLRSEGADFTRHYSYAVNGATLNSEFCVNTGFIKPYLYEESATAFLGNEMPYSIAEMFRKEGYGSINAYHMNKGAYYSRSAAYGNWGYDAYNGLYDRKDYGLIYPTEVMLDSFLLDENGFGNEIFTHEEPFVSEIITYTVHCDFSPDDKRVKALMEKFGTDAPKTAEEVARLFVRETDDFVRLLIERLKENGLYDDTVIVGYADHYLVSLSDDAPIRKYKGNGNERNNTPFFIWDSKGLLKGVNDKINSQTDILPTLLNLFGIRYDENWYMGNDIFDEDYKGYVIFHNMEMKTDEGISPVTEDMMKIINKNDLILMADYFRK